MVMMAVTVLIMVEKLAVAMVLVVMVCRVSDCAPRYSSNNNAEGCLGGCSLEGICVMS